LPWVSRGGAGFAAEPWQPLHAVVCQFWSWSFDVMIRALSQAVRPRLSTSDTNSGTGEGVRGTIHRD
jgi:hypothetical protein